MTVVIVIAYIIGYLFCGFVAAYIMWRSKAKEVFDTQILTNIIFWPVFLALFVFMCALIIFDDLVKNISNKIETIFTKFSKKRRLIFMRKILRRIAKARMAKRGIQHINKHFRAWNWRGAVNAYPIDCMTGKRMNRNYVGQKKHQSRYANHLFVYQGGFR